MLNGYDTILGVYKSDGDLDFLGSRNKYVIREINGDLYRIEYDDRITQSN